MKPARFEYKAPDSIEETLTLLRDDGRDAKLLAGGQSLVPAMNFRVVQPGVLIDLNRVGELNYIRQENRGFHIGAMIRERQLEFDPLIPDWFPLLAEAMPHVVHPQIRNRGTLGGSLDTPPSYRQKVVALPGSQTNQQTSDRVHAGCMPSLHGRFSCSEEAIRIFSATDRLGQIRQSTRNLASRSMVKVSATYIICES